MQHKFFGEIQKFRQWEATQPEEMKVGAWQCDYDWRDIYSTFGDFALHREPHSWTEEEKDQILYILAHDWDMQHLAGMLSEDAITLLTEKAILDGPIDAKWQLALELNRMTDKHKAISFLEMLVHDTDEYVQRRASQELEKLQSNL